MDDEQKQDAQAKVSEDAELEALIQLIEARVVENLTRAIERLAQERDGSAKRP